MPAAINRHDTLRSAPTSIPARSAQLLLVEDDPADARQISAMLDAGWGAEVQLVHVETLGAALEHLAHGMPTTCVLLDLTLPDARGLDGLARLRDAAPEVPIVVLCDHADETTALRAMRAGAQDHLLKGRVDDRLVSRAVRYAVERKRSEAQLLHQATHDALTELPNRSLFLDHVAAALGHSRRVGVILLDLDRFATVNDSLGHAAGDQLLVLVAARLGGVIRETDVVARFGGDEFAIVCDDVEHDEDVVAICERVSDAVAAPFAIAGTEVFLTASSGIAFATEPGIEPDALVRDADAAMHRAKACGTSRHELFDEVLRATAVRRMETGNGLHRALERGELRIHYQPKISLVDGRITALEALLRWQHPERGLIQPAEFIPQAEETGLIVPIGHWVIESSCALLAGWQELGAPIAGQPPLAVAVNLSARQLAQAPLADQVADALERHRIVPESLMLELTESLVVGDDDHTRAAFAALREIGVLLAIDDFGTGYASLAALKRFPVDVLKIDRSFVAGLGEDTLDRPIVSAVVGLAHDLGLIAVAEGVETQRQLEILRELRCDLGQGFLFSRPVPAAAVGPMLLAGRPL